MKHFLILVCAKIGRFFWSWGFLKFCLWAVTLIILFYAEEDWRGARAWAATKAEWEAKGESFDFNKFIPPPVPDDQNLAAIPLFKLVPNPTKGPFESDSIAVTLQRALALRNKLQHDLPNPGGHWQTGQLPDWINIRKGIADMYAEAFKGAKPPGDALAQLDALYPFLTDLRIASATRPLCRFPGDYARTLPSQPPFSLLTEQITISNILRLRILLELDDHQPDSALGDLKTGFKLMSGAGGCPALIGGLVAIGMNAIINPAIYDGLATHVWNDAQLAELQDELDRIDFLSVYQYDLHSHVAGDIIPVFDYWKKSRPLDRIEEEYLLFGALSSMYRPVPLSIRLLYFWPDGWLDQNKRQLVTWAFNNLKSVDPKTHRVFPQVADDLLQQKKQADARLDAWGPWNCRFTVYNMNWGAVAQKYAQAQVWVDEMRIACALERYRLAHNAYPDSLDALVPAYAAELPRDIFNGEPYHYQLRPDGVYLLYSVVGWDQTDEGGQLIFRKDAQIPANKPGGWIWSTLQPVP